MLPYSGRKEENAPHTQGVALMLSKVARNALIGWEFHGLRIIKVSFKSKRTRQRPISREASIDHSVMFKKGPDHPDGKLKLKSWNGQHMI
ncbi:unnamed protein product [Schistosoma mattheei]|uniref:Uncharacterized protein n=1 Tax=Schistosoma mattheei TaxID=31246 RepID=A0A183PIT2_9TREM|nr:unnamed protein product [Schistosoma mattheei]